MRRAESRLTIAVVVLVLISPWLAGAAGVRPSTAENRPLTALPDLTYAHLLDATTYTTLESFLVDHTPLRREVASATNTLLIRASGQSPMSNVFLGRNGTLFLSEDFTQPCAHRYDYTDLAEEIHRWEAASPSAARQVLYVVAPDKSSVLVDRLDERSRLANDCQQRRHAEHDAAFADGDDALLLREALSASARAGSTDHTYFRYDSHWTYWGAAEYAAALVDRFAPGQFDWNEIVAGAEYVVQADIARRLGWDRREPRPVLSVERPGVETALREIDIAGTRTVREYRSTSDGTTSLVPGRTLVLQDSMNNFAELMIAPHFEHVEFVHWNDIDAAQFWRRVSDADRIVIETVERQSHVRLAQVVLEDEFRGLMAAAIAAGPAQRLRDDVERAVEVLRDVDVESTDLAAVPGFGPVDHPTHGAWSLARQDGETVWLQLDGVPASVLADVDASLAAAPVAGADGVVVDRDLGVVRVRVDSS